eukprot:4041991-Amphidinium_carterae.1
MQKEHAHGWSKGLSTFKRRNPDQGGMEFWFALHAPGTSTEACKTADYQKAAWANFTMIP